MGRDFEYQWGQLVARAWDDPAFKARLMTEPQAVLEENGLAPAGKRFQVLEDTDEVVHLVLPGRPGAKELSEEELGAVSAEERCLRCGEQCHRCAENCYNCRTNCYVCERC